MATAAQIAVNQENAKKSTGPRTVEGKRRSSSNALTFGLFANDIRQYFSPEDRIRYDDFIKIEPEKLGFDFSKKELVKRFLTSKVMMHAYSMLQPGIPDEDIEYAFGERMRMLIKLVDAA